jgi:hypothetical protein
MKKRCPWCMEDLKEEDKVATCPGCGRQGCRHCMPKGSKGPDCNECTDEKEEDQEDVTDTPANYG